MKTALIIGVAAVTLFGCATGPEIPDDIPQVPNAQGGEESWSFEEALNPEAVASDETAVGAGTEVAVTEVPLVEYASPQELVQRDTEADPVATVESQVELFTVVPREEEFLGGAVVYNFVPRSIYKVFTAPLRVTNIELEAGEVLSSQPASGDTLNFQVGTAVSENRLGERTTHLLVKPVYAGQETSLLIYTNRRIYQFELESYEDVYMPYVSFRYPLDSLEVARQAAASVREEIYLNGSIEAFDFGYEIVFADPHKPRWAPSVVFTDGVRTYMQFASAYRAAYAPVVFEMSEDGERMLVNYRVVGDYYIVDSVLDRAELVLDINAGNIVTIVRRE